MKFRLVHFLAALVVGLAGASLVYAQDAPPPTIAGVVKSHQAAVSGALVLIKQRGEIRRVVTDGSGSFVSPPLTPGACEIVVRADGYQPQTRTISLPEAGKLEFALASLTAASEDADPGVALLQTVKWSAGGSLGVTRAGIGSFGLNIPKVQLNLSRTTTSSFRSGGGSLFSLSNRYETSRNQTLTLPTSIKR